MRQMGQRLAWLRDAMGKSQEEMARIVGLHQTAWSFYERGRRMPDQFEIIRLCARLGITLEYLLHGSLQGVERGVAIILAARHPELVEPRGTGSRTDKDRA